MYFSSASMQRAEKTRSPSVLTPSELTQALIQVPGEGELEPFGFEGQSYMPPIYDTVATRVLLLAGRQVGKSSLLGNIIITKSIALPFFLPLYVSPTIMQTSQFANDRIKMPVTYSPKLQPFFREDLVDRVNHRVLTTGSEIRLRNAFLNADRIRGIRADLVCLDELQDILVDLIPIIEQTTFRSPYKIFLYSGTPKTEDNTIAQYWSRYSTQNEWLIPCDNGREHGGKRYWNIPGEANVPDRAEDGLVCASCKKPISAQHKSAAWVSGCVKPASPLPFAGYRIPQIITPMVRWSEILDYKNRYSRSKFLNEILGLPCDTGNRPLTRLELLQNCHPGVTMLDGADRQFSRSRCRALSKRYDVFMGVDWGADTERSFTYITLGSYFGTAKFVVFLAVRCEGKTSEIPQQLRLIRELHAEFNVKLIGSDYGGGLDRNDALLRTYGAGHLFSYQYASNPKARIKWDPKKGRFIISRSEIMTDIFSALKRGNYYSLLAESELFAPRGWAEEALCIRARYNEMLRLIVYEHSPGTTDDGFHSLVYLTLVAGIMHPRPDIILPGVTSGGDNIEDQDQGQGYQEEVDYLE